MSNLSKIIASLFLSLLLVTSAVPQALAQLPKLPAPAASTTEEKPADALGRETPRGTINGFLKAIARQDYKLASEYLDMGKLSAAEKKNPEEFTKSMQQVLDRYGQFKPEAELSNQPEGREEGDLPADIEVVGVLQGKDVSQDIQIQRVTLAEGSQIWLLNADFVSMIPTLSNNLRTAPIQYIMVGHLESVKLYGVGIGQWLAMLGLYITAFIISNFLARALIRFVRFMIHKHVAAPPEDQLVKRFTLPLKLAGMVWIAYAAANFLGFSVIVRHAFSPIGLTISLLAVGIFMWRLVDTLVLMYEHRMAAKERYNMTSVLSFARRTLKFIVILILAIMVLSAFGFDVTTGLAALGIGGIALALGAQKTLENFIGSISIITDQPLHVGDLCKIGDVQGTVEDIGMRSTRLRTADRTVVTIPNGDLSTQRIENFARRSRLLYNRTVVLRYDTTPEQIRSFMAKCEEIFKDGEKIVQEGVTVRLLGFVQNGFPIQFWGYVQTRDGDEYLHIQTELTLKIVEAATAYGVYFAIPSQTFLPAVDQVGTVKSAAST